MYHDGNRTLQDEFGSRALADRLEERLRRDRFNDDDAAFIAGVGFFFLATADAHGAPDCSFKGGPPGFVSVAAPDLLVFPDYDGNGMFKSLGNLLVNPQVGLLFIAMGETPKRLRVNGRAEVVRDDPAIAATPGAQLLIKVTPMDIFPNCPRYIRAPRPWRCRRTRRRRTRSRSSPNGRASRYSLTSCRRAGAETTKAPSVAGEGLFRARSRARKL